MLKIFVFMLLANCILGANYDRFSSSGKMDRRSVSTRSVKDGKRDLSPAGGHGDPSSPDSEGHFVYPFPDSDTALPGYLGSPGGHGELRNPNGVVTGPSRETRSASGGSSIPHPPNPDHVNPLPNSETNVGIPPGPGPHGELPNPNGEVTGPSRETRSASGGSSIPYPPNPDHVNPLPNSEANEGIPPGPGPHGELPNPNGEVTGPSN